MIDGICPIWGTIASFTPSGRDGKYVDSPRAGGKYFISGTALAIIKINDGYKNNIYKALLTTWLVEQRHLGVECPEVYDNILKEVLNNRRIPVQDRADALLRYIQSESKTLGDEIRFFPSENLEHKKTVENLFIATESVQVSELVALSKYCDELKWITHRPLDHSNLHCLSLKPQGYARLAELEKANINSKQAFVAMWFDPSMDEAYEQGIKLGIEDAGYKPVRIDSVDHNNKIDDAIIAEIRRSRFLVADFTQGETGARGGVYYEAGFAHGLNIPVIFTCRKDSLEKVHFDTRQYNHIVWEDVADLRKRLADRISATIGDGPNKTR